MRVALAVLVFILPGCLGPIHAWLGETDDGSSTVSEEPRPAPYYANMTDEELIAAYWEELDHRDKKHWNEPPCRPAPVSETCVYDLHVQPGIGNLSVQWKFYDPTVYLEGDTRMSVQIGVRTADRSLGGFEVIRTNNTFHALIGPVPVNTTLNVTFSTYIKDHQGYRSESLGWAEETTLYAPAEIRAIRVEWDGDGISGTMDFISPRGGHVDLELRPAGFATWTTLFSRRAEGQQPDWWFQHGRNLEQGDYDLRAIVWNDEERVESAIQSITIGGRP